MLRLYLFFLLSTTVYSAALPVSNYNASIDTILKAVGTTPCMRKCIDPLMNSFSKIWEMKDIKSQTKNICQAYEDAVECLEKDQFCDITKSFVKVASALTHRCQTQYMLFEGVEDCVNPHLDSIAKKCDDKCHGREALISYANKSDIKTIASFGGNSLLAAAHITDLCKALSCVVPCYTNELNAKCKSSGWIALDAMMQPLEAISASVNAYGPAIKNFIVEKMDSSCQFIVDSQIQKKIRKGDFSKFTL